MPRARLPVRGVTATLMLGLAVILGLAAWGGHLEGESADARRLGAAAVVLLAAALLAVAA